MVYAADEDVDGVAEVYRTALRSSYGLAYDFVSAQYLYIAGSAPPFSNRIELNGLMPFEDPYSTVPGGQTHPVPNDPPANAPYPGFGAFGSMDPDNNSPRVQSWNVTLERQIGGVWQASASYLGSYADRLWGAVQVNPGRMSGTCSSSVITTLKVVACRCPVFCVAVAA